MARFHLKAFRWVVLAGVVGFAGPSLAAGGPDAGALPWIEKTIPLRPNITFVKASFLTGEIVGLKVVERIDPGTGLIVGSPMLEATLTVWNDSQDHAAHLLGGKIEYIAAGGTPIPTANTSFVFTMAPPDRLDPGKTVSHPIEIAFPPAGLRPDALREVRLQLVYLPIPYQTDTVNVPVYLGS
jgi:hypothetical protein